jgi:hypothetical protein
LQSRSVWETREPRQLNPPTRTVSSFLSSPVRSASAVNASLAIPSSSKKYHFCFHLQIFWLLRRLLCVLLPHRTLPNGVATRVAERTSETTDPRVSSPPVLRTSCTDAFVSTPPGT